MKRLIVLFMALAIVCLQSQAQNDVVKMKSDIGQGYLVLHQLQNVHYWKVTIIKRNFDEHGQYTDKTVQKHTLDAGINYVKIPSAYRLNLENGTIYFASIEGFSKTNSTVVKQEEPITRNFSKNDLNMYIPRGPIGGTNGTLDGCSWTCDGTYYAWTIQEKLIGDGNGNFGPTSYLELETAYQYFDEEAQVAIPYYRYMSATYWSENCWNLGYSCEDPEYQGVDVIGYFDGDENNFYDDGGLAITGLVAGVKKDRGPWEDLIIKTDNLFVDPCGASGYQAIGFINNQIANMTGNIDILECDGLTPIDYVFEVENEESPFGSCFDEIEIDVQDYEELWTMFQTFYDCLSESSDSPFNNVLESLTILDLNDEDNKPIAVDISKALETDPNTTTEKVVKKTFQQFINQSTDPSLLCMGVEMKKGVYAPFLVDVSGINSSNTNNPNSRLTIDTEVSITPNPSFTGTQTIAMVSPTAGTCTYELISLAGQPLERRSYNLERGAALEFEINTKKYAAGVLIHKFNFSDGTQKTYRSVHF